MFINYATGEIILKVVYYGMGLCGKTTNLRSIHDASTPETKTKLLSLATLSDRTLFFDLLPLEVGTLAGMRLRLQLYTVPGQVFYNETRQAVLKGADGVVFCVDSQRALLQGNVDSLKNLRENLRELGIPWEDLPIVVQYNKRDLRDVVPTEELDRYFSIPGAPSVHACAYQGIGVSETLRAITRQVLKKMPLALDEEHRSAEAVLDKMPETDPTLEQEEPAKADSSGTISAWGETEGIESSDPLGLMQDPSTSEIDPVEVSQLADGELEQASSPPAEASTPKAGELHDLISALQGSGWIQDESTPSTPWPRGRDMNPEPPTGSDPVIADDSEDLLISPVAAPPPAEPADSGPIQDAELEDSGPINDPDLFSEDSGPIEDDDLFNIDSSQNAASAEAAAQEESEALDEAATVVLSEEDEAARDAMLAEHALLAEQASTAPPPVPTTSAPPPPASPAPETAPPRLQSEALRGFVARLEEISPPHRVEADQSNISTDAMLQEIARKAAELAKAATHRRLVTEPPAWMDTPIGSDAAPPRPASVVAPEPPAQPRPSPAPVPVPPETPVTSRAATPPPVPRPKSPPAEPPPAEPPIQSRITTLKLPEANDAAAAPSEGATIDDSLRLSFEGPVYCDSRFAVEALVTLPEAIPPSEVSVGLLCDPERIGLITHPLAPLSERGGRTRFPLVAVTEGWHRLQSFLLWQGRFVARAGCELFVFGKHHVGQPYVTATEPKASPIDLRFPLHEHDLLIGLFSDRVGDEYRLSYFLYQRQTDTVMVPRPLTLPASPTTVCRKALAAIASSEALRREGQLVSAGVSLWNMLIPPELEMIFGTSGESIDSVLIVSEDTWIPWEILRSAPDELPLGATYRFGQWPGPLVPRGSIARAATLSLVGGTGHGDDGAILKIGSVTSCRTRESAIVKMTGRVTDLLYVRGPSESDPDLPAFSALSMPDGPFQVADLQAFASEVREARPWIFLDPLAPEDEDVSADSGASAWASGTCGRLFAGGLVAPRLALTKEASREAWQRIEQLLLAGVTIGAALREVRRYALTDPDADATLMTFALFGDPEARLET